MTERCPVPMRAPHQEAWLNAVEAKVYKKLTLRKSRYGRVYPKLPPMLRTLMDRWLLGGILCELYRRYTKKMFWVKGYSGKLAAIPPASLQQFVVPREIIIWAFAVKSDEDIEIVQDYIKRKDEELAWKKHWPKRGQLKYWFGKE